VSYKTSLPEIIGQNAIYIDPYNISDIYRALKNLKEDEALRKKMFDNSQNYVLQSWPEQIKEVIEVFNSFSKKNENRN
jgi:glycosyltransferase involved in cell wall biosynthesis